MFCVVLCLDVVEWEERAWLDVGCGWVHIGRLHGAPGTGDQRGWVLPGVWMGAVWGVVCGEVVRNVCVLCGAVFGRVGG